MTAAADRPLSMAEQSELRHELRTPFNHVLGYAEMLLEAADDEGHVDLVPGLKQLHADGKALLGVINSSLSAERSLTVADVQALRFSLRQKLQPLTRQIEALLAQARSLGCDAARADLERIERSLASLGAIAEDRFVAVPSATSEAEPNRLSETESDVPPTSLAPGKVLVVDDNEINRDLLCRRLKREGLTTASAADGRQALEALRSERFDLVLLDVVMPNVDGFEVLRVIKETPQLRDVPVLMISALDEMQSVVRCIEMGAEDFLTKPFDPVLLRARVGACLEKKRLRDRELEYLRGVASLEQAASSVEASSFEAARLDEVAARSDELGRLARVFQRMAGEVQAREKRLKEQVAQLRIEIDMVRLSKQVEEVTQAPVFDSLLGARDRLRQKRREDSASGES